MKNILIFLLIQTSLFAAEQYVVVNPVTKETSIYPDKETLTANYDGEGEIWKGDYVDWGSAQIPQVIFAVYKVKGTLDEENKVYHFNNNKGIICTYPSNEIAKKNKLEYQKDLSILLVSLSHSQIKLLRKSYPNHTIISMMPDPVDITRRAYDGYLIKRNVTFYNIIVDNKYYKFLSENIAVNGSFDVDTSGWTATGTTNTWVAPGQVSVLMNGLFTAKGLNQTIPTETGAQYYIAFDYISTDSPAEPFKFNCDFSLGFNALVPIGHHEYIGTATTSSQKLRFFKDLIGADFALDNVIVRKVEQTN